MPKKQAVICLPSARRRRGAVPAAASRGRAVGRRHACRDGDADGKLRKPARDDRADDGLRAAVPDDGLLVPPTEVTVLEGDTAFTLLERVCAERDWRWTCSAA